jgi:hypothetical protein
MSAPTFGLICGLVYIGLGILGLLGFFAENALLSGLHFLAGIWGVAAWIGALSAVTYARSMAVLMGALALMGLIPGLNTLFGLMPLHGHVWLHAATAVAAAYFGFRSVARQEHGMNRRHNQPNRREAERPVAYERRRGTYDRRGFGGTLATGFK